MQKMNVLALFYNPLLLLYGHQIFCPPGPLYIPFHSLYEKVVFADTLPLTLKYSDNQRPEDPFLWELAP